ncbi:MAG TPA: hypothetical protein VK102_03995, partial [Sphingobacterium sp.]|nr:hypothetical protein [Sphingobacterium sp.]
GTVNQNLVENCSTKSAKKTLRNNCTAEKHQGVESHQVGGLDWDLLTQFQSVLKAKRYFTKPFTLSC